MKIDRLQKWIPNFGANYDELPPVPVTSAKLWATAPTLTTFKWNVEQYTFDNTNDYVIWATEITHSYKEWTDLEIHIHWATNWTDADDRTVKWQLEYTVSNWDVTSPFTESFPNTTIVNAETTIPGSTADRAHILTSLWLITWTGLRVWAYITWRMERIASSWTEPTSNPFWLALWIHAKQNTLGSRQLYIK